MPLGERSRRFWHAMRTIALRLAPRPRLPEWLAPELDMRLVGRTLFHAAMVGVAAGALGALFLSLNDFLETVILERWTGYQPLRAMGERPSETDHPFRPWLLVFLPALGGLAAGWLSKFAPETRGGGADVAINAFHHKGGELRARVLPLKALTSLLALGSGASGGREGPTMLMGAVVGSMTAGFLNLSVRERRILLVSGVAAGISAVFRTPLGAALLAVEILYRDGFESDALVPSVLSSVVSYSTAVLLTGGEAPLFGHAARFPFVPGHLPWFALLAILTSALAVIFLKFYRSVHHVFEASGLPAWLQPAAGGLALGMFAAPMLWSLGKVTTDPGQGLGLLGGGYGAAQVAISGAPFVPIGWWGVALLLVLCVAKILATSLSVGSGGSAGDFAPSLAIGGLFGGAFGRAAGLISGDARLDAGAFALVAMGSFYGGVAHAPLSALVLVCEMAGNYDLLVPLMLSLGVTFIALRNRGIYNAQAETPRDSPAHRASLLDDVLSRVKVGELLKGGRAFGCFEKTTTGPEMLMQSQSAAGQDVFPVLADGVLVGLVTSDALRTLAVNRDSAKPVTAADIAAPPTSVGLDETVANALRLMAQKSLREMPVVHLGAVVGLVDEAALTRALQLAAEAPPRA